MAGPPKARRTELSGLERVLSIVTEVKPEEGVTAVLMTLNVFFLLTAYYVIKPVREGLILATKGGAESKSYLGAAIAIALLLAVPAYARFADRVAKNRLVVTVTLFFASHLVVFWVLSKIPAVEQVLGFVFFIWVGIFNMMVVAQFWAFANDLYTQEQGKRLFALIGIGASLGAALGAYVTSFLTDTVKLGVYELLIVSALLLVACALLSHVAHARERGRRGPPEEMPGPFSKQAKPADRSAAREGAFALVLRHRYLTLIAIFSLLFTWVNTNGEYVLSVLVKAQGAELAAAKGIVGEEAVRAFSKTHGTAFYAEFFLWVNVIGVALQTFAVSRVVKLGGLRIAFFVLPAISLVGAASLLFLPAVLGVSRLSILRPSKIAENATDYSLNNTVRNMLWLPTTTEMKYKAKQAVDTFFIRMGDVASAALVYVGAKVLGWPVTGFAVTNLVLVGIWLVVARGIVHENARLSDARAS